MNKPCVLKVSEVAKLLRIQRQNVYILIEEEILEGIKLKRDWRITTESVERMIGPLPLEFYN